jgi:leader peptidase (prepilin peptidase) / N-methyltransferase
MTANQLDTWAMAVVLAVLAANLGSFSTVLAHRKGAGLAIQGRSQCRKCSGSLTVRDLIPILSWVWLRGRCRQCRQGISVSYPATEASFALIAAAVVLRHGASLATLALAICCLGAAMAARIDLSHHTLPNPILAVTASCGLSMFALAAFSAANWTNLTRALSAAGIAFVIAALVYLASKGRLGEGDVKFAPLIWLPLGWLGWGAAFAGYLVTSAVALAFAVGASVTAGRWRGTRLPLGPALASGLIVTVILDLHWPAELSK